MSPATLINPSGAQRPSQAGRRPFRNGASGPQSNGYGHLLDANVVQKVMRHQSITLTMDTYGHLFPGQEADAVGRMREMLVAPPEAMRATGTDGAAADSARGAQHQAQQSERETVRRGATGGDEGAKSPAQEESPKPLAIAVLGDDVRPAATDRDSSGGGTRTPDTRITIPHTPGGRRPAALRRHRSAAPPRWTVDGGP